MEPQHYIRCWAWVMADNGEDNFARWRRSDDQFDHCVTYDDVNDEVFALPKAVKVVVAERKDTHSKNQRDVLPAPRCESVATESC